MGASPLRMAEQAETRERHHALFQEAPEGIGGLGVELRTLGPLDHTNVPLCIIITTNTYVHDISMCFDVGVKDCSCCSTWPELVGIGGNSNGKSSSNGASLSEAIRFSEASATAQSNCNGAATRVGPEGKSKRRVLRVEQASVARVRTEGNDHGKELEIMVEHLRREFPLVISKSRRRQHMFHGLCSTSSVDTSADIHEQEHAQIHTPFVDNPLTRFADFEHREHICVGPEVDDR